MSQKDYYKILEVSKDATEEEIKKSYRKLALKFHPDKTGGDDTTFKNINEAYEILSNKDKKNEYDNPNLNPFGNINVSGHDIFEQMFTQMHNMNNRNAPVKRQSFTHIINIPLKSSHFGLTKTLKINIVKNCLECLIACQKCNGNGIITQMIQVGPFMQQVQQHCHICNGSCTVKKINLSCTFCHGKYEKNEEKLLKIDIPIGVDNGYTIHFPGLGEQVKKRGDQSGDLHVKIMVDKDPYFDREGYNLIFKCKITLLESLIGKNIIVPYFNESINININMFGCIDFNNRYHLKGKGLNGKGDLIFEFVYEYKNIELTGDQRIKLENCYKELNLM